MHLIHIQACILSKWWDAGFETLDNFFPSRFSKVCPDSSKRKSVQKVFQISRHCSPDLSSWRKNLDTLLSVQILPFEKMKFWTERNFWGFPSLQKINSHPNQMGFQLTFQEIYNPTPASIFTCFCLDNFNEWDLFKMCW